VNITNNPLLKSDDLSLLNTYPVGIEIDSNTRSGIFIFNNRRFKVQILTRSGDNWQTKQLEEEQMRNTAQKVAVMLLKKNLLQSVPQASRLKMLGHDDSNQTKDTRADYDQIVNYLFNKTIQHVTNELDNHQPEEFAIGLQPQPTSRKTKKPRGIKFKKRGFNTGQRQKLEAQSQTIKSELQRKELDFENLEKERERLAEEKDQLAQKMEKISEDLRIAQEVNEINHAHNQELRREREQLESENKKITEHLQKVEGELQTLRHEVKGLRQGNEKLLKEIEKLNQLLNNVGKIDTELNELRATLASKSQEATTATDELNKLRVELAHKGEAVAQAETELNKLRTTLASKNQEATKAANELNDLRAELASKNQLLTSKESNIASLLKDNAGLIDQLNHLEDILKDKNNQVESLKTQLSLLDESFSSFQQNNGALFQQMQKLQDEQEKTVGHLRTKEAELAQAIQAKESIEKGLESNQAEIRRLTSLNQDLTSKISGLEVALKNADKALKANSKQLDQLESVKAQLSLLSEEFNWFTQDLASEIGEVTPKIEQMRKDLNGLADADEEVIPNQFEKLDSYIRAVKERIRNRLTEEQLQIDKLFEENDQLKRTYQKFVEEMGLKLKNLQQEKDQLTKDVKEQDQTIENQHHLIIELKRRKGIDQPSILSDSEKEGIKKNYDDLITAHKKLQDSILPKDIALQNKQQALQKALIQLEDKKKELAESSDKINWQEKQIQKLKRQVTALKKVERGEVDIYDSAPLIPQKKIEMLERELTGLINNLNETNKKMAMIKRLAEKQEHIFLELLLPYVKIKIQDYEKELDSLANLRKEQLDTEHLQMVLPEESSNRDELLQNLNYNIEKLKTTIDSKNSKIEKFESDLIKIAATNLGIIKALNENNINVFLILPKDVTSNDDVTWNDMEKMIIAYPLNWGDREELTTEYSLKDDIIELNHSSQ
jgi:DNA repair exonuclease SbcCD ATPase subunit